jgi:hypothetical protein
MVVLSNPEDAPRADPHAGCCGSRGRKTPGDPIMQSEVHASMAASALRSYLVLTLTLMAPQLHRSCSDEPLRGAR